MVVIGEKNYTKKEIDEVNNWLDKHYSKQVVLIEGKKYTEKQIDEIANYLDIGEKI
jgi:hypothetical protein